MQPDDEPQRLAALRETGILDTSADPRYDGVTAVAEHGVRCYAGAPMLLQDGHAAGGHTTVTSVPGEGTTVRLTLPQPAPADVRSPTASA